MQSSHDVVDGLLRGKAAERVAVMETFWPDTLSAWVQQGYPTRKVFRKKGQKRWCPEDGQRVVAEQDGEYREPVPPWKHFDLDMAGTGGWFDIQPIRGVSELVEETDEWEVKRNGAGAALKYWKHKSGTPEHIDFRMTSRAIWERDYRPHLVEWDANRVEDMDRSSSLQDQQNDTQAARTAERWVHFGHMFIWEIMRQSMGDVTLYESLLLDPDWIRDFNRVYTDLYKQAFSTLFDHNGMPDGIWLYEDLGYKNGLFASPKVLEDLIFPYFKEMVDFFHGYDLPVVLHSCGSVARS